MRAGAGVVKIAVPRALCEPLIPLILESTLFPLSGDGDGFRFEEREWEELTRNVRTAAAGMGMENTEASRRAVAWLLTRYPGTLILDADGLNALAGLLKESPRLLREAPGRVLLTPHPGEFARLTGKTVAEIQARGLPLAEEFAREQGVTVLLKGPATLVTDGRETWLTDRGSPGMATAGSGDVLSGILAAVCASEAPLPRAAAAGAWLNGRAGEIAAERMGETSMTAGDTVRALPEAVREIAGRAGS